MIDKFETLRKKLHDSIKKNGIDSEKTKKISAKFDELVNSYYKNEKQYHEYDFIYTKYKESLEYISKVTKEFGAFPTTEEWNKFAKEKGLLCSESLKYISGLNWHKLRNRTVSEK